MDCLPCTSEHVVEACLTSSSDCAFQPILQSLCCSLVQPGQEVPGQAINVAELQDRLFYQAWHTSSENSVNICCDSFLMLPNRPYHVLARMALSSCLVAKLNHPPCRLFHGCVVVKLSVSCKPIANTRLGLATSSITQLHAILSNATSSVKSSMWSSCSFRSQSSSYEPLRN